MISNYFIMKLAVEGNFDILKNNGEKFSAVKIHHISSY